MFFLQTLFLGYYQLSRLYYCFANSQIHSNKGYSDAVFMIMYSTGLVITLFTTVTAPLFMNNTGGYINSQCGYREYQFYHIPIGDKYSSRYSILGSIGGLIMLLWDVTTYILYIHKIRIFVKYKGNDSNESAIKERILSTLYKITIITSFYEILCLIGLISIYIAGGMIYCGWNDIRKGFGNIRCFNPNLGECNIRFA